MGEVDHEEDAVDEGVAQRDEGVDAAQGDAGDDEVLPVRRADAALGQGEHGTDQREEDQSSADGPEDQLDCVDAKWAASGHLGDPALLGFGRKR